MAISELTLIAALITILGLALVITAYAVVLIAKRSVSYRHPSENLQQRIETNLQFLQKKELLYDFVLTECALQHALETLGDEDLERYVQRLERQERSERVSKFRKGLDWFKEHKGKIAEKLFDKLNDVAKGFIPGAS